MRHAPFAAPPVALLSLMDASHALLLKTYNSETDGRARSMGHGAFEDATTPPGAFRRESIGVRTMAFF